MIVFDKNKCPQDHKCPAMSVCPKHAIRQKNFELPTVDEVLCIKCCNCVKFCPKGAIKCDDL